MTILPVVERELRVAARERNTYRVRFLAAFITVLFSGFSLWFVTLLDGRPIPPRELFVALVCIEFAFVLVAGFSLTADSVSEEKRESTLGLLFLTDLKGHDIILGKLAGALLRGLYALIATIPILALPLMLGGTSAGELGRTALTLLLTLFFSICVGLLLSTFFKKSWTAYGVSALTILIFAVFLPIWSDVVRRYLARPTEAFLMELPSPTYALRMSFFGVGLGPLSRWGWSILAIAALALGMLVLASRVLPVVWKDRPPKARAFDLPAMLRRFKFGGVAYRQSLRRRLLAINPVFWLSRRERISSFGFLLFIGGLGLASYCFLLQPWPRLPWEARLILSFICWMVTASVLHLSILLRLPVVAAERFSDDLKSGALELLLSTPMSVREILHGHWLALRRYFAGPFAAALLIHLVPIFYLVALQPVIGRRGQSFGQLLGEIRDHLLGNPMANDWENHFALLIMLGLIPVLILSWVSLAHFSTYLSLKFKRALAIPPVSLLVLHAPPWLGLATVAAVIEYNRWRFNHSFSEALFYYTVIFVLECTSQMFWTVWSHRRLLKDFRVSATDRYQPPKLSWKWFPWLRFSR